MCPQVYHDEHACITTCCDYRHKEDGQVDVVLMNPALRRLREGLDTEQLPDRAAQL